MTSRRIALGELFRVGSSKRVLKSQWQSEGVPFYRGREVTRLAADGFVENELFISEELYSELSGQYGVPSADDIMITAIGTIGNSYVVRSDDRFYFKDASVLWLKKTGDVSSEFVNFWLKSAQFFEQLDRGNGATVDTLTIQKLQAVAINLPTLPEQRRIVAILDEAFEGIATAKANAEKNLQNVRELFNCEIERLFSQPSNGGSMTRFADLCNIKHGYAFDGAHFSAGHDGEGRILLTPGNFSENGRLEFSERNTKRYTNTDVPPSFVLNEGDLVVVMTDLSPKMKILGKPAIVERPQVLHNQRIGRVVELQDRVATRYVYYFMRTAGFVQGIKRTATGTMVKHTAPVRILDAVLPLPSVKRQAEITDALDEVEGQVQALEINYQQRSSALDELKKSLLHQAFSGAL